MKNLVLVSGLVILFFTSLSFKSGTTTTPPGTIKISTNLYTDKTEITNLNWLEYMYWTKRVYGENSKEYTSTIPDTTVWNSEKLNDNQKNYLRNPEYANYPVVGITYEQALQFCKWRSDRVNEMFWIKETGKKFETVKDFKYNYDDLPKVFEYRLPSKEEWISITKQKNVKELDKKTKHLTYPVNISKKKVFYGLNTNVSEMTSEKGIAMGGNWKTKDNFNEINYNKPSNTIGFRCVCVKLSY